ncbi:hypothetical protein PHSC3_000760 [Chlamydiales bacterium STE3]|nr:hypothetical protein PHSC3_000760 [Chlamydiales bacterium STE3]
MNMRVLLIIFCALAFFFPIPVKADWRGDGGDLFRDLTIVDYWNRQINDRLPVTYNHLLQGGYFNMPSARMSGEGELAFGYSYVPPYRNYNLRCQLTDFLEISGNYRIFIGVDDPILSPLGFGDMSDKGANVKLSLFSPESSDYKLPGLAIGLEDFMGTRNFKAHYIVATQVFLKEDAEVSVGYGGDRLHKWFGGISWMPFRRSCIPWLEGLSIAAEYDATRYEHEDFEKHPKGRKRKTHINFGLKYRLFGSLDFTLSYVRGRKLAASVSTYYNFGYTKGLLPKVDDPLPYKAPVNTQPLCGTRPERVFVEELAFAFKAQSLELLDCWIGYDECQNKTLRLRIYNEAYRLKEEVRNRLNYLLANLVPADIDRVLVIMDAEGFPIQQYSYCMQHVRQFTCRQVCAYELKILTPLSEVSYPDPYSYRRLYHKRRDLWEFLLLPKIHTFFGSSKGKFKYSLGIHAGIDGYFPSGVYYSVLLGYNFISDLYQLSSTDRLNPSQLINVRTDIVRYYQRAGVTVDEAYIQKCWNVGKGFYSRFALGYFEVAYAGLASEILYYPVGSCFAVGLEGALFKKRSYTSPLGFTDKVRKLHGFHPSWESFNYGSQYFLNLYYDSKFLELDFRIKIGRFLARDYGVRYEVSRYFPSGLRMTVWYTHTNAKDVINGSIYHDKGIALSMPLDIFFTRSSRKRWGYSMSAWLRDIGVIAGNGQSLYELINDQRQ